MLTPPITLKWNSWITDCSKMKGGEIHFLIWLIDLEGLAAKAVPLLSELCPFCDC